MIKFLLFSLSHSLMEFREANLRGCYLRKTAIQVLAQPPHSLPRNSTVSKQQTHDLGGWRQPTSCIFKLETWHRSQNQHKPVSTFNMKIFEILFHLVFFPVFCSSSDSLPACLMLEPFSQPIRSLGSTPVTPLLMQILLKSQLKC